MTDLVGNRREIESFYDWLRDWEEIHLHGNKKEVFTKTSKTYHEAPKLNAKACIIHGPPGVGKTCAVKAVAKTLKYELVSINVSEYTKVKKDDVFKDFGQSSSINKYQEESKEKTRIILFMDEIDGIGFYDKGKINTIMNIV